jgi:hypothetical protein
MVGGEKHAIGWMGEWFSDWYYKRNGQSRGTGVAELVMHWHAVKKDSSSHFITFNLVCFIVNFITLHSRNICQPITLILIKTNFWWSIICQCTMLIYRNSCLQRIL